MQYDLLTLPNGLTLLGLPMPHLHTVSVGLMVNCGSVYEEAEISGISHFIEHMLFDGTEKRTCRDLACEMDKIGGLLNAFTDREDTCFHTTAVSGHLPVVFDLISDMVLASRFDPADIRKEKKVILEEIAMIGDAPDELVYDLLPVAQMGLQKVSRPVIGSAKTVKALSRETLLAYKETMYSPRRAVLALAGKYDWSEVVSLADRYFGAWEGGEGPEKAVYASPASPTVILRPKDIEQTHICMGWNGEASGSPGYYPLTILNTIVGGAISSRMNQIIREKHALAYNVYSSIGNTLTGGQFSVYAGTNPVKANRVLSLMKKEITGIVKHGVTEAEFEQAKEQTLSGIVMSLDSSMSRMLAVGQRLLLHGDILSDEDLLERVKTVTLASVNDLARRMFSEKPFAAIVGAGTENIDLSLIG